MIKVSKKAPRTAAGKRKTTELDSSNSGDFMEPAARLPGPGLLSGVGSTPLSAQARGQQFVQRPVVQSTSSSTGKQGATTGRQISYAEMSVEYAGTVAGDRLKG